MKMGLIAILFIIGGLFLNASHIPSWIMGASRPTHPHWKVYGIIGVLMWLLIAVLANATL